VTNVTGTSITNYTCQTGTWNGTNCVSVITGNPITNYTCNSGYTLVGTNCVRTVTGTSVTQIVCPTGSTLTNGQCISLVTGTVVTTTVCPTGTTLSGTNCINTINGTVVTRIVCPTGTTLSNGQCINTVTGTVVTQTICPTGSSLTNGVCIRNIDGQVVTNIVCPTGSTLTNGRCVNTITGTIVTNYTCPSGYTISGASCVRSIQGDIVTQTLCPVGTSLVNGQCVATVNGTIVTNTVCPTGTTLSNGVCQNTVTPPVVTTHNCPSNTQYVNGICKQIINPPVVTYQTCWDGSVIPATSVCAPQYKVCSNGTSIPVHQTCQVITTPAYIPPVKVTFNNVVTSVTTQITNNSARCNGIGLIANSAPSTGWFEYGETRNLGRTTASTNIGSSYSAPFSNVLANLKPTTTYYCRAVMQNSYGIVKGEIVSFTTKAKATTYVKPVATVTVKKTVTQTPVKKNEVICSDGTTITVKNEGAATLINNGEKLISLQIEKVEGRLSSDASVTYKVNYKNLADTRLTGVVLKVALPVELSLTNASAGMYDDVTRTLTLNQDTIDPYANGQVLFTAKMEKDAPLGKTIVVNVYSAYTVPSTQVQDEVTAYVVGSIVPTTDTASSTTGAKKVVGASSSSDNGFLPNSLIEWLALLAILFIIFILGRSIHASYKGEESSHH
jgi:hypothetical protein